MAGDIGAAVAAVLGGSVSLAGLLLIFSGFLFDRAARFPSVTSNSIIGRYTDAGRVVLIPFLLALAIAVTGAFYWAFPSDALAFGVLAAFVLLVLVTAAYGVYAVLLL